MSGLLGLLDLGAGGLLAHTSAISAVGRNTVNANTEGYSRETVDLSSLLGARSDGGVIAGRAIRSDDPLLSLRERAADGSRALAGDLASALAALEARLVSSDGNLVDAIAALFGGITRLSATPADPGLRLEAIARANGVASAFNRNAGAIAEARADADRRLTTYTEAASQLAAQIADANRAIAVENDPVLQDKRDLAARQLSELVGGEARIDPDGQMRFVLEGGAVMVDGARAATLRGTYDVAYGNHLRLDVVDGASVRDVTTDITTGKVGAQLGFRDGSALRAEEALDALAFEFTSAVNNTHRANAGLDGVTGRDLFVQPGAPEGAAAAMAVAPDIAADPSLLASRAPGAGVGDSTGLFQLSQLSSGFVEGAIQTLGGIGRESSAAAAQLGLADARSEALRNLRDSVSGVSIEEELSKLSKFQHAAEASMRFVSTMDGLLGDLIANL